MCGWEDTSTKVSVRALGLGCWSESIHSLLVAMSGLMEGSSADIAVFVTFFGGYLSAKHSTLREGVASPLVDHASHTYACTNIHPRAVSDIPAYDTHCSEGQSPLRVALQRAKWPVPGLSLRDLSYDSFQDYLHEDD